MLIRLIIINLLIIPTICFATLGENQNSIEKDHQKLSSVYSITKTSQNNFDYQIFSFQTDNNLRIREFSLNNKVFAITWSGSMYPDFQQLLGQYFSQMKTAKNIGIGLTSRRYVGNDFIFHLNGVPGLLSGIAYIPSIAPKNINIYSLK